jgi:hypothetical protein
MPLHDHSITEFAQRNALTREVLLEYGAAERPLLFASRGWLLPAGGAPPRELFHLAKRRRRLKDGGHARGALCKIWALSWDH